MHGRCTTLQPACLMRRKRSVALVLAFAERQVEFAFPEMPSRRPPLRAERFVLGAQRVRELPDRRVERPVTADLAHADEAHVGAGIGLPDEIGERAVDDLGVGMTNRTHRAWVVSSPRLLACAKPWFSHVTTRALGNSLSTSSRVPFVDMLSATTTSSSM